MLLLQTEPLGKFALRQSPSDSSYDRKEAKIIHRNLGLRIDLVAPEFFIGGDVGLKALKFCFESLLPCSGHIRWQIGCNVVDYAIWAKCPGELSYLSFCRSVIAMVQNGHREYEHNIFVVVKVFSTATPT